MKKYLILIFLLSISGFCQETAIKFDPGRPTSPPVAEKNNQGGAPSADAIQQLIKEHPPIMIDARTKVGRKKEAEMKLENLEAKYSTCKKVSENMEKNKVSKEYASKTIWGNCINQYKQEKKELENEIKINRGDDEK